MCKTEFPIFSWKPVLPTNFSISHEGNFILFSFSNHALLHSLLCTAHPISQLMPLPLPSSICSIHWFQTTPTATSLNQTSIIFLVDYNSSLSLYPWFPSLFIKVSSQDRSHSDPLISYYIPFLSKTKSFYNSLQSLLWPIPCYPFDHIP